MSALTLDDTPPDSLRLPPEGVGDTVWRNLELERVAESIIMFSKRAERWMPFSWRDYCFMVMYSPDELEHEILDRLVDDGALTKHGETYEPTDRFVQVLGRFVRAPNARA